MAMQPRTLLACMLFAACSAQWNNSQGLPYVVAPSGAWDGPDGPWASFNITVGTDGLQPSPDQIFRTFPALSFSTFLVPVAADFCSGGRSSEEICASRNTFQFDNKPWKNAGEVDILKDVRLSRFLPGNSEATQSQQFRIDNVRIGTNTADPVLKGQAVGGVASKSFFMGLFGLSNSTLNLGGTDRATLLSSSQEIHQIPSTSFSYTAGSFGKDSAPPSLVLGGYDASRFDPQTTLQVNMTSNNAPSNTSSFAVDLTAITFSGSDKTWTNGSADNPGSVVVSIDSATPQLWLPLSACQVFEDVFGLEWNETAQLYLVNSSTHDHLKQLNTTVTLSLQSFQPSSRVMNFTLPYTAFDLNASYPLVEIESYYFPLKRASSADQYVLGRTFLQETHILVDYEAAYFNISQAIWDGSSQWIKPIEAPRSRNFGREGGKGLSRRAYAGIVVSVGVAGLAMGMLFLAWRKRRWPFKKTVSAALVVDHQDQSRDIKPEIDGYAVPTWVEAMGSERAELETKGIHEVETKEPVLEMHGSSKPPPMYEMDARSGERLAP